MFAESIQIADLGISRGYLDSHLKGCGYWANDERRARYDYVLSPSVYVASAKQEDSLERMAKAAYLAVHELNLMLTKAAREKSLGKEQARFLQLGNAAARGLLRPQDGETRIPPMIKVDLVQDALGNYRIAEVDTYNPRGFGFAAMLEESLQSSMKLRRFPGMEQLCRILRTHGVSDDVPWFVVVSEFERFYRAPYEIFSSALKRRGIHFPSIEAGQLHRVLTDNSVVQMRAGVFSIPDTLFREDPSVRELLLQKYRDGSIKTVYPPVAYLGSKAFLPYLRQCNGMQEFVPPTSLVGKHYVGDELDSYGGRRELVLKAAVSSGMKGVYFSDLDGDEYVSALEKAREQRNPSWVLQEQVPQVPTNVVVFDEDGKRFTRSYYLRITAYISANGVIDAEVTGRPADAPDGRKVHGAKDCIQIPVVLS